MTVWRHLTEQLATMLGNLHEKTGKTLLIGFAKTDKAS